MLLIVVGIFINPTWGAELTIYTYDSFNSEWGPGPVVFKRFEEQCVCKLKVVSPGDSGTVLNRVILEKANPQADILFVGAIGKMEMERVTAAGYSIEGLQIVGFKRKFCKHLFFEK